MGGPAALIENRTFAEIEPGQGTQIVRTLTMADIQAFALVSGDVNPAHVDAAYARTTRFHGVIAHGMWAGALISSLLGTVFPGPGTIYLEQSLRFVRPVRIGDTLRVGVTVREKLANGNLRLDCRVLNQHDEEVVTGEALVRAPTQKVVRPRASLPALLLFDPQARLESWLQTVRAGPPLRCAIVHPCDENTLRGALEAFAQGLIVPLLCGPQSRIEGLAARLGLSLEGVDMRDSAHSHAAAADAAALAARGAVTMLMKGSLPTDELMRAVLAEPGLRTGRRMSHVFRFEVPAYAKPLLVTDAGMHIAPTLPHKADIVRNAVDLAHALGIAQPRVALLAALETVTPRIPATLDAAALCKMAERGQIAGALLDGPLAFDSAIAADAAPSLGATSAVAGCADILVAPDLESATLLCRQLETLAGAAGCGVVLGARVPIAMTRRADGAFSHAASAALAAIVARSVMEQ